jgi:saccharopine dehydrogenase (NAD+, L-lysine-forming)
MRNKIMIIGGHGQVGQYITRALNGEALVLAGRSQEKMTAFIKANGIDGEIRILDIQDPDWTLLEDVKTLIVCVDQTDTKLIKYCNKNDMVYMDVTANSDFINQVHKLNIDQASVVLGIGLAPGITNLLAHELTKYLTPPAEVQLHVILGMGDKHGDEAISWTLKQFTSPYVHKKYKQLKPFAISSATRYKNKSFPTYNFNFVDQHMLNRRKEDVIYTTYFGFDVAFLSRLLHFMQKANMMHVFKWNWIQSAIRKTMKKPFMGSNMFMASAESQGKTIRVIGKDEARFTGLVAGEAAKVLVSSNLQPGCLGIEDLISLDQLSKNIGFKVIKNV